jgi:metallo-beta-lactamase family protein
MATVTFLGAAQEVTGSCHLLESPAVGRVLLDCGMHQGGDAVERIERDQFRFKPESIDAVVLSHGHLDHSGLLPRLYHEGFRGPVYCTPATAELLEVMLKDSAGLYLRDLERDNLRRSRRGEEPLPPVYGMEDVEGVLALCDGHGYGKAQDIGEAATLRFYDAGHILGSAIVELTLREKQREKILVFSGDLGKRDSVLMNDPATLTQADLVMMEGTYGDRDHRRDEDTIGELREILHQTWERGGNVMIPAFAVGRTQEILFHLGCLHHAGELDNWQVFLDSPMAIEVTRIYDRWLRLLDGSDVRQLTEVHRHSLETFLPTLNFAVSTEESMAINRIKRGTIIVAGSGMCTGGRIRHHFKQRIWDARNTVVFIGFQADGTLGRLLVDGVKQIRMFGEEYAVKAEIATLGGFSAHAGQSGLLDWISHFTGKPRVVLVHGEPRALDTLSAELWRHRQIDTDIPARGQTIAF